MTIRDTAPDNRYRNPVGYPVDTLGGITPCLKFKELPHSELRGGTILCETHHCAVIWCAEAKDRLIKDLRSSLDKVRAEYEEHREDDRRANEGYPL